MRRRAKCARQCDNTRRCSSSSKEEIPADLIPVYAVSTSIPGELQCVAFLHAIISWKFHAARTLVG